MNETSTQRRAEPRSRTDRGHDGRHVPSVPERAGVVRSGPGKLWGLVGLVVLTAVTSLVVATISVWLVPVYMAAMVLIFAAPRSSRPDAAAPTPKEVPSASPEGVAPPRADDAEGTPVETPAAVDEPPAAAEAVEPAPAKPRKRRAKARRGSKAAKAAEANPSEPTWIRVGPGKFVRADVQAEAETSTETQTDPTTTNAADLLIEPEATTAADVETDAEPAAVEEPTREDEPETAEFGGEHGNAPSTPAGAFDEEHGNAPSTLVETWTPMAIPAAVVDDEPEPDAKPIEAEPIAEDEVESEARSEIVAKVEVEDEAPTVAPQAESEVPPAPTAPSATAASPRSERPAPGASPTGPRGVVRAHGLNLGLARRGHRLQGRCERSRTTRRRDAVARPARPARADRVRARTTDRGRLRLDPAARRHHPRSPPRRA